MIHPRLDEWFASRGWTPFDFQRNAWRAHAAGRSGLIHAPTGTGKTLAALLGPVNEWLATPAGEQALASGASPGLQVLWLTPMRALANDTLASIVETLNAMRIPWRCEKRTGDTSSRDKARQRREMPTLMVTTPESLTILLSYPEGARALRSVGSVVVDEWHELLGTKRGVQTELALARLRTVAPGLRTWGLGATLGNLEEAARALVGVDAPAPALIRGLAPKTIEVECVIPPSIERFPWYGHLGTKMIDDVIARVERVGLGQHEGDDAGRARGGTTLLFTNTRSQAEIWFREMIRRRPDLVGRLALHHGSLDRGLRTRVEDLLRGRDGGIAGVVCTSSLDLGVDFSPVDQVIQIGSPKGVARLMQRAGRSGHRPGAPSRVVCVASHALELVEFAAARDAIEDGTVERRAPVDKPLDVLSQHLVTMAAGGGFDEAELRAEVASCFAYRDLTDTEWKWTMDFVRRGGATLEAYPDYARIAADDGRWKVPSRRLTTRHRMSIGTIVSDASVAIKYANGRRLGTIEETFIARLRKGDRFAFAGRVVELVRFRQMVATVRAVRGAKGSVPRWQGGKMPLSNRLADAVRTRIGAAADGRYDGVEMETVRPLLELQRTLSHIPRTNEVLIETIALRDGHHAFIFPFGGRLAHEGLGAILSLRLTRRFPASVTSVGNDYGIELVTDRPLGLDEQGWRELLRPDGLVDDLLASVNESELARRQFREIARIAGLTHAGYPGSAKPVRHMQASSDMFYDVFAQFDAGNLLLAQAQREVVEGQLEARRLRDVLESCAARELILVEPPSLTPLAFPLFAESMRATTVSSEAWEDRVRKMVVRLEREVREDPEHGTRNTGPRTPNPEHRTPGLAKRSTTPGGAPA